MAQEFYVDENGNKIPISGTVTSADMLPMSASDSRKVSEAIGSLSTLTTTDKSSLVGAVNEVNKLESVTISTSGAIANLYQSNANKQNKLVVVNLNLSLTSATSLYALLCTMSKKPLSDNQIFLHSSSDNGMYECHFGADGKIQWWNSSVIPSGATIGGQIVYFTND